MNVRREPDCTAERDPSGLASPDPRCRSLPHGSQQEYMTTEEAATYLRKSVSWLLKQSDMPYLRGIPNVYRRKDLDAWYERHMFKPAA